MPRTISWLHRLHEIRRSVATSVRSHYDRSDLESLFELQPRSAQKLLEMLPTVRVGTSRLLERDALSTFLDGANDAEDVPAYLQAVRSRKTGDSRRKMRNLVRSDLPAANLASLPEGMSLARGRLEVSFRSVEQLAESMLQLARILEAEGDSFALSYEPETPQPEDTGVDEVREMFRELEAAEAGR